MRLSIIALAVATALTLPAGASENSGAYLAARTAEREADFGAAASYYMQALNRDPQNAELVESAMNAHLALGDVETAAALADRLRETGSDSQVMHLVQLGHLVKSGDWAAVDAAMAGGATVGPLFDGLIAAWSEVGQGSMGPALDRFDAVIETPGTSAFGLYHKALALALAGDFEGAEAVFEGEGGDRLRLTQRGAAAYSQILAQLGRPGEGAEALTDNFDVTGDPYLAELARRLGSGEEVPFSIVTSATDGVAELFYSIAGAIQGEASNVYTLLYARMTEYLRPDHIDAVLLNAALLESFGRYELASEAYDRVPRDSAYFLSAELGRADALEASDRQDAAIEVLAQLGKSNPDVGLVHISLGDLYRGLERYEDARDAYDRAIALIDEPQVSHWPLYFSRGITHERTDQWEEAEADFRQALALRPGQPQVLNYLGYSMVEMGDRLDEALEMIEEAVDGSPDSGYITDSLGWALYKLGRYPEAVPHMERAVELLPVDPIVNDHLGDVYWAVGREREAEFQWLRALSFDPEPDEAERIRRKLEVGLDVVLAEEGAPPLEMANDG